MSFRNLVLVNYPEVNEDFERISRFIETDHPDIRTLVFRDKRELIWRNMHLCTRPTMLFSPIRLYFFRLLRGAVFHGRVLSKSEECRRLEEAGLPVPRWAVLTPGTVPQLDEFGEYVVMKPDRGMQGADVKIVRKNRVRWREPKTERAGGSRQWLVQEFVYTGPWPVSYRVTTLFGNVLYSWRVEADHSRRRLESRYDFRGGELGGGLSIVSSGRGCTFQLNHDPEIIALGEQAHRAFPDIPLLGFDILREQPSGRLFIIEANASGYTWHFTSSAGKNIQQQFGFDLESQFDGIRKAARILAEKTRELAR